MKKIFLGFFMLLAGFNLWALSDLNNQKGCQAYCESLKTCCEEKNSIGKYSFVAQTSCQKQYEECLEKYQNTPSHQCPEIESCD